MVESARHGRGSAGREKTLVSARRKLHGLRVDCAQVPDLVPILAVAMAAAEGGSRITGAARLRIKESDRLSAMAAALTAAGADVSELPDGLIIRGGKSCTRRKSRAVTTTAS